MTRNKRQSKREKPEFDQKLLDLARVTRVVKGGRRFRFRATLVIGNRKGKAGVGVAKGSDVSDAINKAFSAAKKSLLFVHLDGSTLPHDVEAKYGSAKVLLRRAPEGRGLIAGGAVRSVADLVGIRDMVSKSFGTSNKINVARASLLALSKIQKHSRKASPSSGKEGNNMVKRDVKEKEGKKEKLEDVSEKTLF